MNNCHVTYNVICYEKNSLKKSIIRSNSDKNCLRGSATKYGKTSNKKSLKNRINENRK